MSAGSRPTRGSAISPRRSPASVTGGWRWVLVGDGPERRTLEATIERAAPSEIACSSGRTGRRSHAACVVRRRRPVRASDPLRRQLDRDARSDAARTPIVATRVGGLPDKVIPGRTGWLAEAGDAGSLATALREAMVNRHRWQEFGRGGRRCSKNGSTGASSNASTPARSSGERLADRGTISVIQPDAGCSTGLHVLRAAAAGPSSPRRSHAAPAPRVGHHVATAPGHRARHAARLVAVDLTSVARRTPRRARGNRSRAPRRWAERRRRSADRHRRACAANRSTHCSQPGRWLTPSRAGDPRLVPPSDGATTRTRASMALSSAARAHTARLPPARASDRSGARARIAPRLDRRGRTRRVEQMQRHARARRDA